MYKNQIALSCLLPLLLMMLPSGLLSQALVPSELEGINLMLDLGCVSKAKSQTLLKSLNKKKENVTHYPCIFVIHVATCYVEKLLSL